MEGALTFELRWILPSHIEVTFPSCLLHLAAGDYGSPCWISKHRPKACSSSVAESDAFRRVWAEPVGFAMKQPRCGHTVPSTNSAKEALIPSKRVEQAVWGSYQLKPLQGLPELGCQRSSFTPVKSPIDFKGTACTSAISDIHACREDWSLIKTCIFLSVHDDIACTLLESYKFWEKQCKTILLNFA